MGLSTSLPLLFSFRLKDEQWLPLLPDLLKGEPATACCCCCCIFLIIDGESGAFEPGDLTQDGVLDGLLGVPVRGDDEPVWVHDGDPVRGVGDAGEIMDFCDWACLVVEEETAGNVEEPDDAGEPAVLGETDVGFHVLLVIQCWPLVVVVGVTVGENDGFINVGDELGAQGMLGVNESVLGLCCWV